MRIWKTEKRVAQLILAHAETVEKCLVASKIAVCAYLDGQVDNDDHVAEAVEYENEADQVHHQVQDLLYEGAYLPLLRDDLYELSNEIDEIANAAETCVQFLTRQHPYVPEDLRRGFHELTRTSLETIEPLIAALSTYIRPNGEIKNVRNHTHSVRDQEFDADTIEKSLTHRIFASSTLDLSQKLHLEHAVETIARVSDRVEHTAERLEQLSLKSIV